MELHRQQPVFSRGDPMCLHNREKEEEGGIHGARTPRTAEQIRDPPHQNITQPCSTVPVK